jgi:hypothetical protein
MDLIEQMRRTDFLGPEFLTWLWFRAETQPGPFDLGGEIGMFALWFEDKLVVGSAAVDAQENLFKGGHPSTSLEARTALRLGKLATEAKLRVARETHEWAFTFKAKELSVGSVRIPAVLASEADDKLYERMYLLEQLDAILKGLFGQFLRLRMSAAWTDTELPKLQQWVAGESVECQPLPAPEITRRTGNNLSAPIKPMSAPPAAPEIEDDPDLAPWERGPAGAQ